MRSRVTAGLRLDGVLYLRSAWVVADDGGLGSVIGRGVICGRVQD